MRKTLAGPTVLHLVLVASVSISLAFAAYAQSANALIEKAFELIQQKDLPTAERFLRMGLERDANHALGHYYLAEVLIKQNKSRSDALKHYRTSASIAPESKEGLDALVKAVRLEQDEAMLRRQTEDRRQKVGVKVLADKVFILKGLNSASAEMLMIEDRPPKKPNVTNVLTTNCLWIAVTGVSWDGNGNITQQGFKVRSLNSAYGKTREVTAKAEWHLDTNGQPMLHLLTGDPSLDVGVQLVQGAPRLVPWSVDIAPWVRRWVRSPRKAPCLSLS